MTGYQPKTTRRPAAITSNPALQKPATTVSIKNALRGKEDKKEDGNAEKEKLNTTFSPEEAKAVWEKMVIFDSL